MKTPAKWRKTALLMLATLMVVQVSVSLLARTRTVHAYLTANLEKAFGRPVQVLNFDIRLLPSPSLQANSVTVGEDPAFGNEYFLRAEKLSAGLRWMGLLRGHFEFGTLSLSRPSLILVRNQEGRWNLERWLPPPRAAAAKNNRVYGPPVPSANANRLERIKFDDGRINFKTVNDKQPFAFIAVSGSVEQVSPGRWQLQLEAQPWRSGVALQSAGTMKVRGDLAGTSARLQPAEVSLHWDEVSLADLFRLLRGQDYGVRGTFELDASAKSGTAADASTPPGDWSFLLQARAARIHRWDLTERADNPRFNARAAGKWNVASGSFTAEEVTIQAPRSNLRGVASFSSGLSPSMELRVDSTGVQSADLLSWYRAFHPGVDDGASVEQFITGGMIVKGWPLELESAAFSTKGGTIAIPGLQQPLLIGAARAGFDGSKLAMEPVQISWDEKTNRELPGSKTNASEGRRKLPPEARSGMEIGFAHDFATHSGAISITGRSEHLEEVLKMATALGKPLNHGWELTGVANAAIRWEWKDVVGRGRWNGRVGVSKAMLSVAGLNQPLQLDEARLEWKDGKRTAEFAKAQGFGAVWSGDIYQTENPSAESSAAWKFSLHADHLDATELDRWVGPRARPGWLQRLLPTLLGGSAPTPAASELVRQVNAEGELRVDELTIEKLKLEQVRADGGLHNLQLDIHDADAQWAGGSLHATLNAAFSPRPKYELTAELDRVNLNQLPGTGRVAEHLSGLASGTVHLTTEGVGRDELLAKLSGNGAVRLTNVEFHGWDVGATVADGAPHAGASRWAAGEASFSLQDQSVVLQSLRLDGGNQWTLIEGTVSFSRDAELSVQTAAVGTREHKAIISKAGRVLKISGPLDGPRVSLRAAVERQPAD
jgi:AsmA family